MNLHRTIASAVTVMVILAVAAASGQSGQARASTLARETVAATGSTPYHLFRGTVTSVRRGRSFVLRTTASTRVRIYVDGTTHWHGCDWGDVHGGHQMIVRAYRSHGRWMASRMQTWHHESDDDHPGDDDHMGPEMMG